MQGLYSFQWNGRKRKKIFSEWIKKGIFKPGDLSAAFKQKEFDGVYIPFYRITADAVTQWNGRDKVEVKAATKDEPAEFEFRDQSGSHSESYKDYIEVTRGLEQEEVDRVQPFDDNDTKPYTQELTQGFKLEKPAERRENAEGKSRNRIKKWEEDACRSYCDDLNSTSTTISNLKSKLIMLPLWILVYMYKEKPYRVLINGQSGKISGKKPKSAIRIVIFILILLVILGGIGALVTLAGGGKG